MKRKMSLEQIAAEEARKKAKKEENYESSERFETAREELTKNGIFSMIPSITACRIISFKSYVNNGWKIFSNFAKTSNPFLCDGFLWSTSEAAYQMLSFAPACRERYRDIVQELQVEVLRAFHPDDQKKLSKAFENGMPGLLPKFLSFSNKERTGQTWKRREAARKALGLTLADRDLDRQTPVLEQVAIWTEILSNKFAPGTKEAATLEDTGNSYLLELSTRSPGFWDGYFCNKSKQLVGFNFMGKMLMLIREKNRRQKNSV